jgi:CRP-like cAMP-binding protein
MFEIFERYIKQTNKVSDQDLDLLKERCVEKKVRKGQYLLNEGEVWSLLCFIASGCFRVFRTDKDGVDHTFRFGIENWWVTEMISYNHGKPSDYNIEALTTSTILVWTKKDWEEILSLSPAVKLFNDQLHGRAYEAAQKRIYSLISKSATEKYFEFQEIYPKVFNKVPLHMVASYLGISRETLSRIRRENLKETS